MGYPFVLSQINEFLFRDVLIEYKMKYIIIQAISKLAKGGRIFCSEADFQFALAWELQGLLPKADIFLEKAIDVPNDIFYIDIVVFNGGRYYYIELKYHTSLCDWAYKGSTLHLKEQSAQDLLRYDYLKDINRLLLVSNVCREVFGGGYAIALTNDRLVYDEPRLYSNKVLDYYFRIHERKAEKKIVYPVPGTVKWNNETIMDPNHWTKHGERSLTFSLPRINTEWTHYLSFFDNNSKSQVFKYLLNEI